jgi:hypothetical protein
VWDDALAAASARRTPTIDVPQRDVQPAGRAQRFVRWALVRLRPPQRAKGRATLPHVPMQAAVAAEQTSPLGVAALRRVAVTAPDVTTQDDALRVVRQRRPRRLIERSHDMLNSDGRIKRLQRETIERLQRALAVSGVVARRRWGACWPATAMARRECKRSGVICVGWLIQWPRSPRWCSPSWEHKMRTLKNFQGMAGVA